MNKLQIAISVFIATLWLLSISIGPAYTEVHVSSVWTASPPRIDGIPREGEWDRASSNQIRMRYGFLSFQHDNNHLYALIDLVRDTNNNPPQAGAPWGDFLSLAIDVNGDREITPNVDVSYGFYPGTTRLGVQTFLGQGKWTGLRDTNARAAAGFSATVHSETPHRWWEVQIPFDEIRTGLGKSARVGIRAYSQSPSFDQFFPVDFQRDLSNLVEVNLANPKYLFADFTKIKPARIRTSIETITERFDLNSIFGDRDVYDITLQQAGPIHIKAAWRGSAKNLALILNGPGQEGYYARADGSSPLEIKFDVTPELLDRGKTWTVSVVNFNRQGAATGALSMQYPVAKLALKDLRAVLNRKVLEGIQLDQPSSGSIERTFTEDGDVKIRYPDGTTKIYFHGGVTVIQPNGESLTFLFSQVQPDDPPALPSDPQLVEWLEWSNSSLLEFIRSLVNNDETAVNHYLQKEAEHTINIFDQMRMRTSVIGNLLSPQ